jgi:TolA-binding protein
MHRFLIAASAAAMIVVPAQAQSGLDGRVGKLESEMRAVQRKVFPGGAGATVEPQITPQTLPPERIGVPTDSPITDLTARVTSLEQQIASMTGQIEQSQYRLRQLEDQFTAYKKATDARLSQPALAQSAPPAGGPLVEGGVAVPAAPRDAKDPGRAAEVAAVQKPSSGDAAEDGYLYGYRLWEAKLYPEAETQLKKVVTDNPKHRRASFAQNLLGRAYLDDGKPSLASLAFYDSYKNFPDGERAPDSLLYLGKSLMKLNKSAEACKAFGELTDVYGAKLSAGMKADVVRARTDAKCK